MKGLLSRVSLLGRIGLPLSADVAMAVALTTFALLDLWVLELSDELSADRLAATPFAIVVPAALAWRRRWPVVAACGAAGAVAIQGLLVAPTTSVAQIPTLLVLAFSLGAHESVGRAALGLFACVAAILSIAIGAADSAGGIVSIPFFLGVPWLAGLAVRAARGYAVRLERLTEQLERERERSSRDAIAQERARIARELHDVVAHGVGVMGVQAAGARRIVERDPERARAALASIESTGRAALVELERMLELMRTSDDAVPSGAAPTLAELPELAERFRAAGLNLELVCEGSAPSVPPALELAAFRIVQEALTNAVKHAPGAPVRAAVRLGPGAIELEVLNGGNGGPSSPAAAGGHGLIGMRERVALFRGVLETGPQPEGGFRVHARIPVPGAST